jgi:hypothetical protein
MDASNFDSQVYRGVWVNWTYGRVFGSTLTLSKSDGALLIAFIAFFTAAIGAQLWRIVCFILFRIYSKHDATDALRSQRQVILRNSSGPLGDAWIQMRMLCAWRRYGKQAQPLRRLLPLFLITVLTAIALTVASGLSSRIAQGSEALIGGSNCGYISSLDFLGNSTADVVDWSPYESRRTARAAEYAQRCYESTSTPADCGNFVRNTLPMTKVTNASCPFDESICQTATSNILLDSGLIDSHFDLGLNSPPAERFQFRYQLHCAPLATENYRSTYRHENITYILYQYGKQLNDESNTNYTFAVNMDQLASGSKGNTSPFLEALQEYTLALDDTCLAAGLVTN